MRVLVVVEKEASQLTLSPCFPGVFAGCGMNETFGFASRTLKRQAVASRSHAPEAIYYSQFPFALSSGSGFDRPDSSRGAASYQFSLSIIFFLLLSSFFFSFFIYFHHFILSSFVLFYVCNLGPRYFLVPDRP